VAPRDGVGPEAPPPMPEPSAPPLDFAELRRRWPELRETLIGGRIDRMVIFSTAELVDVVGQSLVVKVGSGHLKLLDDEQKRRELRAEATRVLGRPADVRFVDDYVRPARAAPGRDGVSESQRAEEPDRDALAAADPVVQCGLRLFGGPLVRVDEDAAAHPEVAPAASEPPARPPRRATESAARPPVVAPDSRRSSPVPAAPAPEAPAGSSTADTDDPDVDDATGDGSIVGRGGLPVRDWYNY
jgi:hypothetical protein